MHAKRRNSVLAGCAADCISPAMLDFCGLALLVADDYCNLVVQRMLFRGRLKSNSAIPGNYLRIVQFIMTISLLYLMS